ncbi:glucose 1-dehydrogenase [Salinisphaera sp. Q1T1-3]|uniref:glucose 1-dehydrogenase n=1 Tax=Salinisphaera sp. Q1T1-3 TaxID=2321229 RepID=UPI000E70EE65|nr:glucose 1-dehydrogenase [Salinisphaera sp. Q1T1-3]RJS93278.1 glucose 1-dehydrogenase [Salinisphaera sp. Q1T1-3]
MTDTLFDVTDRLALVTGSSRGLGQALATGLAERGARVVLHGRDAAALAEAASRLAERTGTEVTYATFDITDAEAVQAGVDALIGRQGVPDILVNNAGLQKRAPFAEFAPADWDRLLATNLSSAFYVAHALAAAMSERGAGKIINLGSVQSMLARETIVPYAASKGGVAMLTKGMAADLARYNIQVNCISPGYFQTDMNTALWQDPDFDAWLTQRTPAARWGQLEELVGTLIYLCSPASNFVSGQNIFVDGGLTSSV